MPLFQRRKPLPLGLSESELVESNAALESIGITIGVIIDEETARKRYREHLKKLAISESTSKVWMFHVLGGLYFEDGKLEEAIATCSRAAEDYSADPRAWYSLGVIYYGLSESLSEPLPEGVDWRSHPLEIQERMRRVREFREENQQLVQAFRKSKLVASREEAAKLALEYFRNTLVCNISNDDKHRVQTHIRLIEVQLALQ